MISVKLRIEIYRNYTYQQKYDAFFSVAIKFYKLSMEIKKNK